MAEEMAQHLAAVKLEAAESKYKLEQQIAALTQRVEELVDQSEHHVGEVSHLQNKIEQLKIENSTKYRMEERSVTAIVEVSYIHRCMCLVTIGARLVIQYKKIEDGLRKRRMS
jgi:hypothetical protein